MHNDPVTGLPSAKTFWVRRSPDIKYHRLTRYQTILLRIAAAGCVVIAALAVILQFFGDPPPTGSKALVGAAISLAFAVFLWRGAWQAIVFLSFIAAVAVMLSVVMLWNVVQDADWTAAPTLVGILVVAGIYLHSFGYLCMTPGPSTAQDRMRRGGEI